QRPQDPGADRVQVQVRAAAAGGRLPAVDLAPGEVLKLLRVDEHVFQHGGAAASLALADSVPVIDVQDALAVGRDADRHLLARVVNGGDAQEIRIKGAGGVELAAVQP